MSIRPNHFPSVVVGLTGPNASGKGEVAKFLTTCGYTVHSLSNVVREAATREGLAHTRDNLIAMGIRLRSEGGAGALARNVLPLLAGRAVVDSIRNPGEVAVLSGLPLFRLLGIDAPLALRFRRSLERGRVGDGATLEEFAHREERENSSTDAGQQLLATMALSDAVICNDVSLEVLAERVRDALAGCGIQLEPADLRKPGTGGGQ